MAFLIHSSLLERLIAKRRSPSGEKSIPGQLPDPGLYSNRCFDTLPRGLPIPNMSPRYAGHRLQARYGLLVCRRPLSLSLPSQSGVMACSFPHGFPLGRISDVPSGPIQLSNCRQPAQARRKGGGPVPIGVGVESPLILMCILGRSSFSNKLLPLLIVLVF